MLAERIYILGSGLNVTKVQNLIKGTTLYKNEMAVSTHRPTQCRNRFFFFCFFFFFFSGSFCQEDADP